MSHLTEIYFLIDRIFPGQIADLGTQTQGSVIRMVMDAGPVAKGVLLILLFFSVFSWGIILHKWRLFKKARVENSRFKELFYKSRASLDKIYNSTKGMKNSPLTRVFLAGYHELRSHYKPINLEEGGDEFDRVVLQSMDGIARALESATAHEVTRLEKALIFLATTGATTPFIGLFGTVWGVMTSFQAIGLKGSANIAAVAPGISEALIATAAGLFAAIPGVIAYNYFVHKVKVFGTDMDNFSLDFLSLVERNFLQR